MGQVYNSLIFPRILKSNLKWSLSPLNNEYDASHICIPVKENDEVIIKANVNNPSYYAFLKAHNYYNPNIDDTVDNARYSIEKNTSDIITIPVGCKYLYILNTNEYNGSYQDWSPQEIKINGKDILISLFDYIDQKVTTNQDIIKLLINLESEKRLNSIEEISFIRYSQGMIASGNVWAHSSNNNEGIVLFPISEGDTVYLHKNDTNPIFYAILANFEHENYATPEYADGEIGRRSVNSSNPSTAFIAPANSKYLYILKTTDGINDYYPSSIKINGIEYAYNIREKINELMYTGKIIVKYESGSFDNNKATEALYIYIPCRDHYVGYIMYHYIISSTNCNCWRIYSLYKFNSNFSIASKLTQNGELECAIRLQDRDDFSGGSTHGDEVMTSYEIFADGVRVTNSLVSLDYTAIRELRFVRVSNFYDPVDSTTIIAEHTCEYDFNINRLKINQTILWKTQSQLANCFMAMFTPSKSFTDHYYTDKDLTPKACADYINYASTQNVKKTVIYGENNGVLFEFDIEKYPTGLTGGDNWSLSDNGGINYNKIYYRVANGGIANIGDLWQSTSIYKMKA